LSVGRFAASAPLARLLPGAGPSGRTRQIPPSRRGKGSGLTVTRLRDFLDPGSHDARSSSFAADPVGVRELEPSAFLEKRSDRL